MSYRLETREALPAGIKRIALEQIDDAVAQLTPPTEDHDEAVHEARKSFKKVRAVLRLVRDEVGEENYKFENVCFRDAGRRLSDVRDSAVTVETLDKLREHFADPLATDTFKDVRHQLEERHHSTRQHILEHDNAMAEVVATLESARMRVAGWPVLGDNFTVVGGGLHRVYRRGHKRRRQAYEEPAPEKFHEWRKRVKYLWYHTRILRRLWPEPMSVLADEIHDLSDHLGDHHDLTELHHTMGEHPELFSDRSDAEALVALINRRQAELEAKARPLGERIYAEEPDAFVARFHTYWQAQRRETNTEDQIA